MNMNRPHFAREKCDRQTQAEEGKCPWLLTLGVVIKRQARWAGSALKRGEGGVQLEPLSEVLRALVPHVVVEQAVHKSQTEASWAADS